MHKSLRIAGCWFFCWQRDRRRGSPAPRKNHWKRLAGRRMDPICPEKDPWGFDQKIHSLPRGGRISIWRGSKDDYFAWVRTNCKRLARRQERLRDAAWRSASRQRGKRMRPDLSSGYAGVWPLWISMIRPRAPVECEALEGLITLRVLARGQGFDSDGRAMGSGG